MLNLRRSAALMTLALAAACVAAGDAPPPSAPRSPAPATVQAGPLPAFPRLGTALPAGHTAYDNASLAKLFAVMSHELEGRSLRPHLVRYEGPISVGLEGPGADRFAGFLDGYLADLRRNAGIEIARVPGPANLHLRFVDGAQFGKVLPGAACVVASGDLAWERFARDPLGANAAAVARVPRIDHMTVFIPDSLRPYQVRNCLLEEVPQALGLSNDLYGLGMSSFNDDGAHLWPTKLDYLMLRVLYAPEMATGMDRHVTEARALGVLNRINPAGRSAPPLPRLNRRSLDEWSMLMSRVFSRGSSRSERLEDVDRALILVTAHAPNSPQHCHTLITAGRVLSSPDPARALDLLDQAVPVCNAAHGALDIRQARIRLDAACAMLRLRRFDAVIETAEAIWPVLAAHGQDEKLAALYLIESRALDATEPGSARAAGLRELADAWNAYAMGIGGGQATACRPRQ